jgi:hypothetical protein
MAGCDWAWPDALFTCSGNRWTRLDVAWSLPSLAPRLALWNLVSAANVHAIATHRGRWRSDGHRQAGRVSEPHAHWPADTRQRYRAGQVALLFPGGPAFPQQEPRSCSGIGCERPPHEDCGVRMRVDAETGSAANSLREQTREHGSAPSVDAITWKGPARAVMGRTATGLRGSRGAGRRGPGSRRRGRRAVGAGR